MNHFLSRFILEPLLGPLGPADHLLALLIYVRFSLNITATKRVAYNEKFVHLQVGLCRCQNLWVLGPIKL